LSSDKFSLSLRSVRLQCLDENKRPFEPDAVASGFLVSNEAGRTHLYTCWHVVTGFDPRELNWLPLAPPPKRCHLRIDMQDAQRQNASVTTIGGRQSLDVPLYTSDGHPLWEQDEHDVPSADLNAIGLKVPFWMDAVRIQLPDDVRTTGLQRLQDPDDIALGVMLLPGDPVYIAGFPYGYSVKGLESPTPVVLVRHVAAINLPERPLDFLLDGAGAQGMSGGPVFVQHEERLKLAGIYCGAIYPKRVAGPSREKDTVSALGICSGFHIGIHDKFKLPGSQEQSAS
jgi:hypothetical protein